MTRDYLAILDACVLVPAGLRDTLLRLAETPRLYVPKWSEEILAEVERTLVRKLGKTEEQATYLIRQITCAFPESVVKECQSLEAALNHEKDRHVLAAAISANHRHV